MAERNLLFGRRVIMGDPLAKKHYSSEVVRREIADYCRGRWVALEGGALSSRVFLRYWRDGRPLTVNDANDVKILLEQFGGLNPRTIYGSVNIYRSISAKESLEDPENIAYASPIWDIDGELSEWRGVIEAARIIVDDLEKLGISESVFIKWSGEGAHVHVHERCFSNDVLSKHNPLDIAYSLVGFVLERCREKIMDVVARYNSVKVENEIDMKRVFTAPLSLHRRRPLCCICIKPGEIDRFEVEWANPESFRHNVEWRQYSEGEGDEAAFKAIEAVGGYGGWLNAANTAIRAVISAEGFAEAKQKHEVKGGGGRLGRFQVMGLLQAARFYLLTGDLERAKSFGLNRAIFYAWAKRYKGEVSSRRMAGARGGPSKILYGERAFQLGDEVAFTSDNGWFMIGGQVQRPEDYDNQIARRIDSVVSYERAWQSAIEYLQKFSRDVLLNQQKFFKQVYEPVRDKFLEIVLARGERDKRRDLARWL
ncbi:MAG: hypothetical protein QW305_02105 [Candidatus Bathyarchaeia archaeon]